jgi:hypothetical protein
MSFSIYVNTQDKKPLDQIEDLKSNFIINTNTRVILAFANFNITNTDSIPGIDNMSTDDVNSLIDTLQALYKTHNKDDNAKVSLSIGGKYNFANSELYNKPTELANNINELVTKFKFDGVDFSITDSLPVPSDFVNNVSLLINTLRSINPKLYITLTTEAQAWESWNYERSLITSTIDNINAWQVMEYDLNINTDLGVYYSQILHDIQEYSLYYKWNINPNKTIIVLKPGVDKTGVDSYTHKLSLSDAKFITKTAKQRNYQGICLWSSYIDSKVCDGNDPNMYSIEIKTILELYPPGPPHPLPPLPPTSPRLTKDEIAKIRANIDKMNDFTKETYFEQQRIIDDVIETLKIATYEPPEDPKKNNWKVWVELGLDVVCIILPEFGVPAKIVMSVEITCAITSSTIDYLTDNSEKFGIAEFKLDETKLDLSTRNKDTQDALLKYMSFMYDDPQTYRDQDLKYKDKSYTLRDLINIDIPNKNSTLFLSMVHQNGRQFKNSITLHEMQKYKIWNIFNIYDGGYPEPWDGKFGWIYDPKIKNFYSNYNKRTHKIDRDNLGIGKRIFANDEVWHFHPDYEHVESFGNSDDDLVGSFLNAGNKFINGDHTKDHEKPGQYAGLVYPWLVTDKYIYSQRWYMTNGKVVVGSSEYALATGGFMHWLFIDDGFGNVINPNGVMYRYDMLRTGFFDNGHDIPDDITEYEGEVKIKSSDNKYRYPGCSDLLSKNRIYTDDFYEYYKPEELLATVQVHNNTYDIFSIFNLVWEYICSRCCKRKSE